MDSEIKKSFQKALYYPESRLSDNILFNISNRNKRNSSVALWAYGTIGAFSFVGFFASAKILFTDFIQSGFYEYLSLAFSDIRSISSWKEIALSIVESLPMASLLLSLGLVFVFVLSLNFISKNMKVQNNYYLA